MVVQRRAGRVKPLAGAYRDADLQRPAAADHDVIERELDGAAKLLSAGLIGERRLEGDALRVAEQCLLQFGGAHGLGLAMQIVGVLDRLARTAVDVRQKRSALEHEVLAVGTLGDVAHRGALGDHQKQLVAYQPGALLGARKEILAGDAHFSSRAELTSASSS